MTEDPIDFERFKATGVQAGEEEMPKEAEIEEEPEVDMGMVNTLIMNGVPELAAKHAVFNTGG